LLQIEVTVHQDHGACRRVCVRLELGWLQTGGKSGTIFHTGNIVWDCCLRKAVCWEFIYSAFNCVLHRPTLNSKLPGWYDVKENTFHTLRQGAYWQLRELELYSGNYLFTTDTK